MKPKFLFIHGGPGLNSCAEEKFLGPHFSGRGAEILFWNEPSRNRPRGRPFRDERSFENWLDSAHQALTTLISGASGRGVHLIAHSFGAHAAVMLAGERPSDVSAVTLLCPSADTGQTHKNIVGIAIADYRATNPEMADRLEDLRSRSRSAMDVPMKEALMLAFQDPLLLTHYFTDRKRLEEVLEVLSQPEAAIDLDSFFSVAEDFCRRYPAGPSMKIAMPLQIIHGERDEVVAPREAVSARFGKIAPQVEEAELAGTCHYIQLEEPAALADLILRFNSRCIGRT